jgi:hypothetical protein
MAKRILILLVLSLALFISPSWAASCDSTMSLGTEALPVFSITCHFTPGPSGSATFDFGDQGDGTMTMQFETILTTFDVTLTANEFPDGVIPNPLDPNEFPTTPAPGTVCIKYFREQCVRYDFSGNATSGGLDNVPVKGVDYRGLITLTLNYNRSSTQPVQIPAFAHAPGLNSDSTTFSEDILTSYVDTSSNCPSCVPDPAMGGKTPGISPFAPLYKPLPTTPAYVCSLTATYQTSASDQNPIVEVSFKLAADFAHCSTGPFLRDKTASLSVALNSNPISFADLINGGDSNKFHFDNKSNANVQDINTNKLPTGRYIVTVRSNLFAPVRTPSFNVPNTP